MKIILALSLLVLTGCQSAQMKSMVREKHAQVYVFVERMNDPNRRPTEADKDIFIKATLRDYESYDMIINNWRPSPVMESVDADGNKVDNGK
jgi:pectin methylesterase-like acyl-CoA thioesterase